MKVKNVDRNHFKQTKMTDRLIQKELKLNQRHEEILARREALLRQAEIRLGDSQDLSTSVADHWSQAKLRNQDLLEEIVECQAEARIQAAKPQSLSLAALKKKYWEMVENELPEWENEVKKMKSNKSNMSSVR